MSTIVLRLMKMEERCGWGGGAGVVGGSLSEGQGEGLFLVEGILSERRSGKGSKVLSLLALLVQKYAY